MFLLQTKLQKLFFLLNLYVGISPSEFRLASCQAYFKFLKLVSAVNATLYGAKIIRIAFSSLTSGIASGSTKVMNIFVKVFAMTR